MIEFFKILLIKGVDYMTCPECNAELTAEMCECGICFECGHTFTVKKSEEELAQEQKLDEERALRRAKLIEEYAESRAKREEERARAEQEYRLKLQKIPITTTSNIDGHSVKNYIGVESVEIVIGTGFYSEFTSDLSDFLGMRSSAFERKLAEAKKCAIDRLRYLAVQQGGDAVLSVDIDYVDFTSNRIGVIVSGTVVSLDPPYKVL